MGRGGRGMLLTLCLVVQVGDGSTTNRDTPVAVVGLSSGVAMVALGWVRLFFCCWFGVCFAASGDGPLIEFFFCECVLCF